MAVAGWVWPCRVGLWNSGLSMVTLRDSARDLQGMAATDRGVLVPHIAALVLWLAEGGLYLKQEARSKA